MLRNNIEEIEYIPIDCTLYDFYTIWADKRLLVIIESIDNSFLPYESVIKDIITKDKLEYLISDKELWHRLDRVTVTLK